MAQLLKMTLGHQTQIQQLLNATEAKRLPSTLIFSGPPSIGKKRVALGLAQQLLCDSESGCGECASCLKIEAQIHESLLVIQPDGQQIKIDQTKTVLDFLRLKGWGRGRVIIIDEAAVLTPQAANSLLKALEEPAENVYFFLITGTLYSVLPTIRSRAQIVRFEPLSMENLGKLIPAESWMLRAADGQPDRVRFFMDEDFQNLRSGAFNILTAVLNRQRDNARELLNTVTSSLESALFVVRFWRQFLRDLAVSQPESRIHQDLNFQLNVPLPVERTHKIFLETLKMEDDLLRHVDKNLVFENFIFQNAI